MSEVRQLKKVWFILACIETVYITYKNNPHSSFTNEPTRCSSDLQ